MAGKDYTMKNPDSTAAARELLVATLLVATFLVATLLVANLLLFSKF